MMTFNEAYVWIWLPNEVDPVVAGKLKADGNNLLFNYGQSYLQRVNDDMAAIPIYDPELPLKSGILPLLNGLSMPGCIRDGAPDAWGQRVIINKQLGLRSSNTDTTLLNELTYLLKSGSDRIGALDFQRSASEYVPRGGGNITLEELISFAERVEKGIALTPELDMALYHGSAIGGARPKALIESGDRKYIAKFSSTADLYSVVKAEFIAMRLAKLAGLDVASVKLETVLNKDVLLIERFDRQYTKQGWRRKSIVSVLTIFELDDMMARYASYEALAEIIRYRFSNPKETLRELFARLTFNILCGNTDDHARNHAAFWDGRELSLTPAYDICPQSRSGNEASQAMMISGNNNLSQLRVCVNAAPAFLLSQKEVDLIIEEQIEIIQVNWDRVCDEARLGSVDKKLFWKRQFLNPYAFNN